jgi:tetratricopeptide (TPR) repeat protein
MDRDQLLARALSLADDADWEGMEGMLVEYIADFEDDPAVHCWLGVAERELGREGLAYESFKRALALEPDDPHVLATAGNGVALFDDPVAEQALRAAALTAPHVALTRLLYGAYLSREGFATEALQELEAARELDPTDPQIMYELGVLHALSENYDAAADALADSVRLDPEDGWVRTVFGLVLLEAKREEEATGELMEGARSLEADVEAQLAAALLAAATEREGSAYEMLERARMRAVEGDIALVSAVEDRLESGPEAARTMLTEDLAPGMLRLRLQQRP